MKKIKILFVCLGNICRSPMAEFVMRDLIAKANLSDAIATASCGTSGWHNGEDMHTGTKRILQEQGIDTQGFVSSRLSENALLHYDYIAVMDDNNLIDTEKKLGKNPQRIFKLTDFVEDFDFVPDPWYSGNFDECFKIIQKCCQNWLEIIKNQGKQ
ncbi:MAG: low molecular weight phosphotyrosine protein phosphatase [Neisseriaceae bacterium]|nr:low molecular weight phosphotyrosine protein phosphatase [Neisseriaceae bacterium]MBO7554954.1 low molecular weight phosphotyrosine protein phosphatase [Neisseriaceae bacterium]